MADALNHNHEMALMAMKGNRFEEAVSLFSSALREAPNGANWCGLGYAKTGLIYREQATIEEVVYCFRKAVECEPSQQPQIEMLFADAALRVMNDLAVYSQHCREQARKQKRNMVLGGVATGLGATVGLSNRNTVFTNVVGIAGMAGGAATIFNANSQINEIKFGYAKAITLYRAIQAACRGFISSQSEHSARFEQAAIALQNRFPAISGQAVHRGTTLLICGILGILLFCISPLFSIPTWVMAHRDLRKMDNQKMDPSGRGQTKAGMIMGIVGVVIWCLFVFGQMAH